MEPGCLRLLLRRLCAATLESHLLALALQTLRGDQALDLGRLRVFLLALLGRGHGAADDELPHVILLVQTEKIANPSSTLGAKPLGVDDVRQTGNFTFAWLDYGEGHDGKVGTGNRWINQ